MTQVLECQSAAQRSAFLEELLKLPIEVDLRARRAVLETLINLPATYSLTADHTAYLDLALRKGLSLMTQDKALRAAAAKSWVSIAVS